MQSCLPAGRVAELGSLGRHAHVHDNSTASQLASGHIYLGVPVKLGKKGIEEIIELKLNEDEKKLLSESAKAVKEVMDVLDKLDY